jgi:hypothetical protein
MPLARRPPDAEARSRLRAGHGLGHHHRCRRSIGTAKPQTFKKNEAEAAKEVDLVVE